MSHPMALSSKVNVQKLVIVSYTMLVLLEHANRKIKLYFENVLLLSKKVEKL